MALDDPSPLIAAALRAVRACENRTAATMATTMKRRATTTPTIAPALLLSPLLEASESPPAAPDDPPLAPNFAPPAPPVGTLQVMPTKPGLQSHVNDLATSGRHCWVPWASHSCVKPQYSNTTWISNSATFCCPFITVISRFEGVVPVPLPSEIELGLTLSVTAPVALFTAKSPKSGDSLSTYVRPAASSTASVCTIVHAMEATPVCGSACPSTMMDLDGLGEVSGSAQSHEPCASQILIVSSVGTWLTTSNLKSCSRPSCLTPDASFWALTRTLSSRVLRALSTESTPFEAQSVHLNVIVERRRRRVARGTR